VVEWDGLENRCGGNSTEGSNPSPSAIRSVVPLMSQLPLPKEFLEIWEDRPLTIGSHTSHIIGISSFVLNTENYATRKT
jgi:hypothetical protein